GDLLAVAVVLRTQRLQLGLGRAVANAAVAGKEARGQIADGTAEQQADDSHQRQIKCAVHRHLLRDNVSAKYNDCAAGPLAAGAGSVPNCQVIRRSLKLPARALSANDVVTAPA